MIDMADQARMSLKCERPSKKLENPLAAPHSMSPKVGLLLACRAPQASWVSAVSRLANAPPVAFKICSARHLASSGPYMPGGCSPSIWVAPGPLITPLL